MIKSIREFLFGCDHNWEAKSVKHPVSIFENHPITSLTVATAIKHQCSKCSQAKFEVRLGKHEIWEGRIVNVGGRYSI